MVARRWGKKKTFCEESKMTCTAQSRMTLEEQLAKAEDCVKFDEVYYKLLGEDTRYHLLGRMERSFSRFSIGLHLPSPFMILLHTSSHNFSQLAHIQQHHLKNPTSLHPRKVDKVLCDRAVYRQSKGEAWGDSYLFYEGPQSRWKRGSDAKVGEPSLNVSRTFFLFRRDFQSVCKVLKLLYVKVLHVAEPGGWKNTDKLSRHEITKTIVWQFAFIWWNDRGWNVGRSQVYQSFSSERGLVEKLKTWVG